MQISSFVHIYTGKHGFNLLRPPPMQDLFQTANGILATANGILANKIDFSNVRFDWFAYIQRHQNGGR